jgi:hypothetical protein
MELLDYINKELKIRYCKHGCPNRTDSICCYSCNKRDTCDSRCIVDKEELLSDGCDAIV